MKKSHSRIQQVCLVYLLYLLAFFLSTHTAFAQVPVIQEPRHRVMLENKYVRLIEVHIPGHDTTLYHIHSINSVIVFLNKAEIGSRILGGQPVISQVQAGQTSFAGYDEKPITHQVWNQGDSVYHVMDIELLRNGKVLDSCEPTRNQGIKIAWEQKQVRLYTLDLAAGKTLRIPKNNCAHLLIVISGTIHYSGESKQSSLLPGAFHFYPPHSDIQLKSGDTSSTTAVLMELR